MAEGFKTSLGQLWPARVWQLAREPVDAAAVAVFRIALGLLIAYDAVRKGEHFFSSNEDKIFRLAYEGFEWVPSAGVAGPWLADLWLILGIAVALGLLYRPAMIGVTLLTIFGFLQAEEYYLNHYYLLIIVCILMCLVPANRAYALDQWLFRRSGHLQSIERMHMWLLKGQTEIVLLYAGFVKLNSDWLQLEPLRSWLLKRQHEVFFGSIWQYDWVITTANYGVIALHILGAPLLLWKRTRVPVFLLYCAFHVSNHFVFDIGIFPWMTIAMSTLFFATDWPRKMLRWCFAWTGAAGFRQNLPPHTIVTRGSTATKQLLHGWRAPSFAIFACVWLFSQSVLPLRHFTYAGDVAWTYEGHRFSWRMKLVDRWSPGMVAVAYIPEKKVLLVPPMRDLLSERQHRKVITRPRMAQKIMPKLANMITKTYKVSDVRTHAYYPVGYNNREAILLIDPKVDLATAPTRIYPAPWIIKENDKPLRRKEQFSGKHPFPNLKKMTRLMGLPQPIACDTMKNKWILCSTTKSRQMSSVK